MGFKGSSVEPNFSESQGGRLGRLLPNKHNECTEQESEESIHTFDVFANIINEACSTEQFPTCEICSKYNIIMNLIREAYNKCTKSIGTSRRKQMWQTTSRKQWVSLYKVCWTQEKVTAVEMSGTLTWSRLSACKRLTNAVLVVRGHRTEKPYSSDRTWNQSDPQRLRLHHRPQIISCSRLVVR